MEIKEFSPGYYEKDKLIFTWEELIDKKYISGSLYITQEKESLDILTGKLIIPEGIRGIERYGFEETSLGCIVLPESLTTISRYAFSNSMFLYNIISKSDNLSIYEGAFFDCKNLKYLEFNKISYLDAHPFLGCSNIKKIKMNMSSNAFLKLIDDDLSRCFSRTHIPELYFTHSLEELLSVGTSFKEANKIIRNEKNIR